MENSTALVSTAPWTEPDWGSIFNRAADLMYAVICLSCFLIGTLGNIVSFLYFRTKRKEISTVIYTMIAVNDVLISILILPIGLSYWFERQPGLLFGNKIGCGVFFYLWETALAFSIFLVICLSVTRTICLLSPFTQQKVKYLVCAVVLYVGSTLAVLIRAQTLEGAELMFFPWYARVELTFTQTPDQGVLLALEIFRLLAYVAPAFVVAVSCVLSTVLLTRGSEEMQQRDLQRSRNRATVTILLFALLYGTCNIPLVVNIFLLTCSSHMGNMEWYHGLYQFDTHYYFFNAITTLLLAVNSAANPILYLWRLPPLREFTLTATRTILRVRLNREVHRPSPNATQRRAATTTVIQDTSADPEVMSVQTVL